MVVHEVILDYKVKEICAVNGGAYGGNRVNEKFITLLKELLGPGFIERFQIEEPLQWFNFMSKFERAKKMIENDGKSKMRVEIPWSLAGKYASFRHGNSLKRTLTDAKERGVSLSAGGTLVLSHEAVRELFRETIEHIVQGVKDIFDNDAIEKINCIFMVGGFCECKFLQKAIKEVFDKNGCRVLVPHEAQLAIVKGAVLFGHYQDQVVSRIARKTYGADVAANFDPEIHDQSKYYADLDGDARCNIFTSFVEIGEEIKINSSIEKNVRNV